MNSISLAPIKRDECRGEQCSPESIAVWAEKRAINDRPYRVRGKVLRWVGESEMFTDFRRSVTGHS